MALLDIDSRILLVDDFQTVRLMLRSFLRELGYRNIEEAGDGRKALMMLADAYEADRPFHLVLSDLNMPEITGLELLELVRQDERFKKLPFIMVTAEADRQHVSKAMLRGVTDYIVKPFAAATVAQKIADLMARS